MPRLSTLALTLLAIPAGPLAAQPPEEATMLPGQPLSERQVGEFAHLALEGIPREFPNKPSNVMTGPETVLGPRQMHPVFYGSFDWHSSVHGHWMLVRLAKTSPDAEVVGDARALLDRQLTAEGLAAEAAYFDEKQNRSFERMYGWAWTLRLAAELRTWPDADAQRWAANLRPLEERVVELTKDYLPRLTYPIRTGVHPDTAFALAQTLDYARAVGETELETQVVEFAKAKYLADRDYPARFEPSGEDFFSPACNEADLMRRVLPPAEFAEWLEQFLPGLGDADAPSNALLTPAVVSDVTDPKIVHLAGLNLSRGWTQNGVLAGLPADDPRRAALEASVAAHTRAGLEYVFSGHYEGEHWLATFAVYLLTESGVAE
ncbi:DUF2891 domain-containing protein [Posidoniimonas polymericola]|uniref:DUF2891 domain-containing protein n=1 Tax=Posidoniimonas polymericola TaxID=2528002 RepID=UPI001E32D582|nr:DUF2891 domain-containing protein [Posidoniimonas polymericola]